MSNSPWLSENHRAKLVQARNILSGLVDPPFALPGHPLVLPIQSNTEEHRRVLEAMGILEDLLQ
jgi:hypothetical protein